MGREIEVEFIGFLDKGLRRNRKRESYYVREGEVILCLSGVGDREYRFYLDFGDYGLKELYV